MYVVVDSGHRSTPSVSRGFGSDNPYPRPSYSFNGRSSPKPKTDAYWSLIGLFWLVLNISFIWGQQRI